ncbi:MAG: glycosyltransferase [bacterium]|nr:glycosyltransferase [bacterium]
MKVLILSTVHRWNDPRILHKEACTLAAEHEIIHAATGDVIFHELHGVQLQPLGNWRTRCDRPKLWLKAYWKIIRTRPDVIHFHDPELALLLIPLAFLGNARLICDIHEHPFAGISTRHWIPKALRKPVAALFSALLRSTPHLYDHVILAEESYLPLFPPKPNVHLIRNYTLLPKPEIPLVDRYTGFDPYKSLRLLYVGTITAQRGAMVMLQLWEALQKKYPNTTLDLVGDVFPAELEQELLDAAARSKGAIKLHPFQDLFGLSEIINQAHLGLIPLQPNPNYLESIATKFFDYMTYGLPCLASNFPLWQQFLTENACGIAGDPTDPQAMAEAIIGLVEHPAKLTTMSQLGYRFVREKYSWDQEAERLLEIYRSIKF